MRVQQLCVCVCVSVVLDLFQGGVLGILRFCKCVCVCTVRWNGDVLLEGK